MSVTKIMHKSPAELDSVIAKEAATSGGKGTLFLLFTGEHDASGHSWCPDCNDADPIINKVLAEAAAEKGGVTLIQCDLPRNEYSLSVSKDNAKHPYRVHPQIKLQRIPTLMRWGAKSKNGELIEGACKDESLVRELAGLE